MSLNDSIAALAALTKKLNSETESLNATIGALDQVLGSMGVGVTFWLERTIASENGWQDNALEGWRVGFTKVGGTWQLAAKKVVHSRGCFEGDPDQPWEDVQDRNEAPVALAKAPRLVRLEGAPHLEELVEKLRQRVEKFVSDLERVNAVVGGKAYRP